ncbi:MAG: hypothetical protein FWG56_10800 [Desulfovibrionaceae bacterium]|jgi:hypothetical protein|nr:hypothetical protein [Desulfovibrionaceae bacterium]
MEWLKTCAAVAFIAAALTVFGPWMDGTTDTQAARSVDADLQQAIADARRAQRFERAAAAVEADLAQAGEQP